MDKFRLIKPTDDEIDFYCSLWDRSCKIKERKLFTAGDTTKIDIESLLFDGKDTKYIDEDNRIREYIEKEEYGSAVETIDKVYSTQLKQRNGLEETKQLINNLVKGIRDEINEVRNSGDIIESYKNRGRIVDKIAKSNKTDVNNRYSFATKFCSFLAPDLFPIFDSISSTLIYSYQTDPVGSKKKNKVSKENMGLYSYYLYIYDQFIENYEITKCYKMVDVFLWMYGKAISNYWDNLGIITYSTSLYTSSDNKRAESIIEKMEESLKSDKKTQNNA